MRTAMTMTMMMAVRKRSPHGPFRGSRATNQNLHRRPIPPRDARCQFNWCLAYFFWESLQQIVTPDQETSLYAKGILRTLAESLYMKCRGEALSPQLAEIFRHFGLTPIRIAPPGEYASC